MSGAAQPTRTGTTICYELGHMEFQHMPDHEGGPWWRLVQQHHSETHVIASGPVVEDMPAQLARIIDAISPPPIIDAILPWPNHESLWSNTRADRRTSESKQARDKFKDGCWKSLLAEGARKVAKEDAKRLYRVRITFHAPNNRRDEANMPGAMKYAIDTLADTMGVNDRQFTMEYRRGANVVGGGARFEVFRHDGS